MTTQRRTRKVWAPEDKVRIVLESMNTRITLAELCRKYALSPGVFYNWREKFINGGKLSLSGALKDPAKEKDAENERLKKLIGELTIANDAMKKVLQGEGEKMSVAIMMDQGGLSLRRSLALVDACRGSFYYYKPVSLRKDRGALRDPQILLTIRDLALEKPMYGTRMMAALLSKELGRPVNRKQVQHAYRKLGWITPQMTKSEVLKAVSDKMPEATGINQSWQTDLTYIRCGIDGFGYLFNVLDVFSREWIAYVFDSLATKGNAIQAVVKALERHPEASDKVTLYSDNGSQYISDAFMESMKALRIEHRFIAYNTPEQNGYIESFHKTLKREYVWPYDFKSFQEADAGIAYAFIDYNQNRPHSALEYISPYEFLSRRIGQEQIVVNQ